jgi:hypothetical protein
MSDTNKKAPNIWYDPEWDFLEVVWDRRPEPAHYTETEDERVMALVDDEGNIRGFQVQGLKTVMDQVFRLDVELRKK